MARPRPLVLLSQFCGCDPTHPDTQGEIPHVTCCGELTRRAATERLRQQRTASCARKNSRATRKLDISMPRKVSKNPPPSPWRGRRLQLDRGTKLRGTSPNALGGARRHHVQSGGRRSRTRRRTRHGRKRLARCSRRRTEEGPEPPATRIRHRPRHLERESLEWLERHQAGAVSQMERRQSKVVQVPKTPREAASVAPLERLETGSWGAVRQPPRVAPGERPQVLLLQMEGLLAESFHRSLWAGDASLHARPGVIPGLLALRKTYILCALCAAAPPDASRMLAELRRRPPLRPRLLAAILDGGARRGAVPRRGGSAPAVQRSTRAAPTSAAARCSCRRLELDTTEIEGRSGGELLCSPTKRRPHVKLLLPGVPTLLVPHPRLQPHEAAVVTSELVRLVDSLHSVSPDDWSAAFDAAQPSHALVKMATPLPSPVRPPPARRSPWDADAVADDDAAAAAAAAAAQSEWRAFPRRVPASTAQGAPRTIRKVAVAGGRRRRLHARGGDAARPRASTQPPVAAVAAFHRRGRVAAAATDAATAARARARRAATRRAAGRRAAGGRAPPPSRREAEGEGDTTVSAGDCAATALAPRENVVGMARGRCRLDNHR